MHEGFQRDLTRTTLAVLFIGGLLLFTFWIVGPFLPAVVWACALVVATWPILLRLQAHMFGWRGPAVVVMTAAMILVFVVPFWLAIRTILSNADQLFALTQLLADYKLPPPPDWLGDVPLVGPQLLQSWDEAVKSGLSDLAPTVAPYAKGATQWFVAAVGSLGLVFLQFMLTVVIAALMYARGEMAAALLIRFGHRLAGEQGAQVVLLAGQAIRGVALGVVVTALAQSVLGGVALWFAGVPFAPVLTAVMFMVCIAQIGPTPVLVPAVIWMYSIGQNGWGTFLLIATLIVISLDNVLRPMLIRRGANLPMVLILAGVIGGLMSFGLVGIFLGPTVLAVAYTLMIAWMAEDPTPLVIPESVAPQVARPLVTPAQPGLRPPSANTI
jgi:predicted PurR-regulated permease PerM